MFYNKNVKNLVSQSKNIKTLARLNYNITNNNKLSLKEHRAALYLQLSMGPRG